MCTGCILGVFGVGSGYGHFMLQFFVKGLQILQKTTNPTDRKGELKK